MKLIKSFFFSRAVQVFHPFVGVIIIYKGIIQYSRVSRVQIYYFYTVFRERVCLKYVTGNIFLEDYVVVKYERISERTNCPFYCRTAIFKLNKEFGIH